jgi:hypothetical protein
MRCQPIDLLGARAQATGATANYTPPGRHPFDSAALISEVRFSRDLS